MDHVEKGRVVVVREELNVEERGERGLDEQILETMEKRWRRCNLLSSYYRDLSRLFSVSFAIRRYSALINRKCVNRTDWEGGGGRTVRKAQV